MGVENKTLQMAEQAAREILGTDESELRTHSVPSPTEFDQIRKMFLEIGEKLSVIIEGIVNDR